MILLIIFQPIVSDEGAQFVFISNKAQKLKCAFSYSNFKEMNFVILTDILILKLKDFHNKLKSTTLY